MLATEASVGDLDSCRRLTVKSTGPTSANKQKSTWERMQKERPIRAHNTLCGLIPSFFMREINVVRLTSIRAAAPSGPATRPFVIFRKRTISSRSFASRVPATGVCLPL